MLVCPSVASLDHVGPFPTALRTDALGGYHPKSALAYHFFLKLICKGIILSSKILAGEIMIVSLLYNSNLLFFIL